MGIAHHAPLREHWYICRYVHRMLLICVQCFVLIRGSTHITCAVNSTCVIIFTVRETTSIEKSKSIITSYHVQPSFTYFLGHCNISGTRKIENNLMKKISRPVRQIQGLSRSGKPPFQFPNLFPTSPSFPTAWEPCELYKKGI